jgi:hypothetical protein
MAVPEPPQRPIYEPTVPSKSRQWLIVLALVAFIAVCAWADSSQQVSTSNPGAVPGNVTSEYSGSPNTSDTYTDRDTNGDLDCSDLPGSNYDVSGGDPYGLDRDGDGIGCESSGSSSSSAVDTPSYQSSPSGGSTTNWCGKRDGDGDGIYCE